MTTLDLDDTELALISKHRAEVAKQKRNLQRRLNVLEVSLQFEGWLQKNDLTPSFSDFVNQFGYQGSDARIMYEQYLKVSEALAN